MAELLDCFKTLHLLSDKGIATLTRVLDRLLDQERLVLCEKCCKTINYPMKIKVELLTGFQEAHKSLKSYIEDVTENPRVAYEEVMHDQDSAEFKTGLTLLNLFRELFEKLVPALRPASAELETLVEEMLPMNDLKGNSARMVLSSLEDEVYESVCASLFSSEKHLEEKHQPAESNRMQRKFSTTRLTRRARFGRKAFLQERSQQNRADNDDGGGSGGWSDDDFEYEDPNVQSAADRLVHRPQRAGDAVVVENESDLRLDPGQRVTRSTMNQVKPRLMNMRATLGAVDMKAALFATANTSAVKLYVTKRTKLIHHCERLMDIYTLSAASITVCGVLSEMLRGEKMFSSATRGLSNMLGHLIRTGLPLFERALSFEKNLMRDCVYRMSRNRLVANRIDEIMNRIVYKTRMLDAVASAFDFYVFPRSMKCSGGGVKHIACCHIDHRIIATAGYDGAVRIFNTLNGKCLAEFYGHSSIVVWVTFSSDDRFLVSASFDCTMKIWDSKSGNCRGTLDGHDDSILSADLSDDDKLLVSASMDGTVRLWGVSSGKCLRVYRAHSKGTWVKSCAFVDGGLVSGGLDGRVVFWNFEDEDPAAVWIEHKDYVLDIKAHGRFIVTTSKDKTMHIIDTRSKAITRVIRSKFSTWFNAIDISIDGKVAIASNFDNYILFYEMKSAKVLRSLRTHNVGNLCTKLSRNGRTLFVGTQDGKVQVLRL